MPEENVIREEFRVKGEDLLVRIKQLLHEGNIRRIIIKNEEGVTLIEVPLTLGMVGAILVPVWAALGALAAIATSCTIVIERVEPPVSPKDDQTESTPSES